MKRFFKWLFSLILIGLVVWLLLWLIDQIPLPDPFGRMARIVVIVVGVLIVILLLLQLVEPGTLPRLK